MDRFEDYLDKAKDLAEDAGDMAKSVAGNVISKAKELTDDGSRVRELADSAREQTTAAALGAKEKVQGLFKDVRAVKEIQLAVSELETFPDDGSILYKMDLEAIINDMKSLSLFVSDNRLDDASAVEEIHKVMEKVKPSEELTEEAFSAMTEEQQAIEKAKRIAYGACERALAAQNAAE